MSDQVGRRIRVACPHCGAVAEAPVEYAGRRVKCAAAACRRPFELPPAREERRSGTPSASNVGSPQGGDSFADESRRPHPSWSPPTPNRGLTSGTVASNPGRIRFNPIRWCRYQPLTLIAGVGFAVLMFLVWGGLRMAGHSGSIPMKDGGETPIWGFGIAGLVTMAIFVGLWARKFRSGDANPGVVIALDPPLAAVPTDLTQGEGEFPAIKIIRINLQTAMGEPLRIGSRIPTVATYAHPPNSSAGHWSDFYPTPAEYVTGDRDALERLLASFPEEQYEFVAQALRVIERPYRPGLYAMWSAPGKLPGRRIKKAADF